MAPEESHADIDTPLTDMPEEAVRIVDRARDWNVQLRLMGGLAVRMHCSSPEFCERVYSDIDLIGLSTQAGMIEEVFAELGSVPDSGFNVVHGGRRLK